MDISLGSFSFSKYAQSKRGWVIVLGLLAILATSLVALVWYNQRPDTTTSDFRNRFNQIRDLEAKWNSGILSLQLGILPNYDLISDYARDLNVQVDALKQTVAASRSLSPLLDEVQAYTATLEHKTWLFDQVKASYAMLRNAVSVIPNAISDCFRQPDVLRVVGSNNERVSDLITESITGMMGFAISPTPLLHNAVKERLERTRNVVKDVSPELADAMERFLAQVDVVVRERLRGNELMLAINSLPTDANAARVSGQLLNLESDKSATERNLWLITAAFGVLLILVFSLFVYFVSRRFLKLDNDNQILHQVNQNVEEQLVQSTKLSALGQMVAGITHEINTPLAYVKAVFELIKERLIIEDGKQDKVTMDAPEIDDRHDELIMLLDDGLHGLDEIATLVRTMKNFSRLDKGQIESFSVEEALENALLIAKSQVKYVAEVKKEFDGVPPIMSSPTQLRQVFLNLIVNAADAMESMDRPGVLTLRTRMTSSDTIQIDILDNGPGIPEENMAKLFDPFFTTKAVGHGTGMGLSICYRIIENHGGTIAVNSKVGMGTLITITLPRQDEKQKSNPVAPDDSSSIVTERRAALG